ncbi:LysR family transcriptional regulator [Gymnodinialimonas sp. 2305UL16-5]|uniref:LysR family transcriptional regulator n=1 Tax=Gymnodinialimonas mytili TaxID=3126503 RepID=UPI0030A16FC6
MIDLNTLRYFTSAYETGTFSQAARVNGVSQPTISAAIQKLEDRLGIPLFRRSKVGLKPSPFAARLYHDVVDAVTHLASLETRLLSKPPQTVKVYCAPDMLMHRLAPKLNSLRRRFTNLQFTFTEHARESELAYVSDRCVPETHAFLPVEEEPFYVAAARAHPLAASREINIDDLRNQPLIQRPYCPHADRLELTSSSIVFAAHATNDHQLLDLISAGLGVAFVPASHAQGREDIVLLSLMDVETGMRTSGISHRKSVRAKELAHLLTKMSHRIEVK